MEYAKAGLNDARLVAADVVGGTPPFSVERRNPRSFVEVALDYRLTDGEKVYQGVRLSRCLLTVKLPPRLRKAGAGKAADNRSVKLHIPLSGFELALDVAAIPVVDGETRNGLMHYRIAADEVRTQAVLAQIVRTALTGVLPTVDDLVIGQDEETPQPSGPAAPAASQIRSKVMLGTAILALAGAIVVFGANLWASATTIATDSAQIAAPHVDVLSLNFARVGEVAAAPGTRVTKGQRLLSLDAAGSAYASSLDGPNGAPAYVSPCDCRVEWAADEGITVKPGVPLMVLSKTDAADRRVVARVPAEREQALHPGQSATVKLAGKSLAAHVESVGSNAGLLAQFGQRPGAGTVPVLLKLDGNPAGAPAGTAAEVVIYK